MKPRNFAYKVTNKDENEAVQRVAFSLGYKWEDSRGGNFNSTVIPMFQEEWLIFSPEKKKISCMPSVQGKLYIDVNRLPVALTIFNALWYLKNEQKVNEEDIRVHRDGSVEFLCNNMVVPSETMERIFRRRKVVMTW